MFWTIVGAILFVMVGIPLAIVLLSGVISGLANTPRWVYFKISRWIILILLLVASVGAVNAAAQDGNYWGIFWVSLWWMIYRFFSPRKQKTI